MPAAAVQQNDLAMPHDFSHCNRKYASVEQAQAAYWFPAKTYGWGWGPPVTWQSWVVLVVYAAVLIAAGLLFSPGREPEKLAACVAIASAILIGICWLNGEPPEWRWGSR